jgi:hypothetical protein
MTVINTFADKISESGSVEAISYKEYIEMCRLNGFEYVVVGRMKYIPFIDFFELRPGIIALPCRSRENGRNIILDFIGDGMCGHFYTRKMIFPEDNFLTQTRKFIIRHDHVDVKTNGK